MGEAHLSGLGHVAAAGQAGIGYCMMRGAELPLNDERDAEIFFDLVETVSRHGWDMKYFISA